VHASCTSQATILYHSALWLLSSLLHFYNFVLLWVCVNLRTHLRKETVSDESHFLLVRLVLNWDMKQWGSQALFRPLPGWSFNARYASQASVCHSGPEYR
jgi:hypothetical protein